MIFKKKKRKDTPYRHKSLMRGSERHLICGVVQLSIAHFRNKVLGDSASEQLTSLCIAQVLLEHEF